MGHFGSRDVPIRLSEEWKHVGTTLWTIEDDKWMTGQWWTMGNDGWWKWHHEMNKGDLGTKQWDNGNGYRAMVGNDGLKVSVESF